MLSENQPLLDPEKGIIPNLITPGSNIHIAAEVQLPPYHEDGHVRYYATLTWEWATIWVSFVITGVVVDHFAPHYNTSTLLTQILIFILDCSKYYFIIIPLSLLIAAIVSGRRHSICKTFYICYRKVLPKRIKDSLSKYILAGV
ncbi:hypothetical protein BC941DRAFT_508977 [Chlamydoabsidia padenii]|nr:hypothetical protein BC941DRAFT_508977 [Chlamydoabsidia padenii]